MKNKKLEIICIYCSIMDGGPECNFSELKEGRCSMAEYDLKADNFDYILGGFLVAIDGYKIIFREMNFYTLLKPMTFLMETLYWLAGRTTNIFDVDEDDPSRLVLETMSAEKLVLTNIGDGKLTLSFLAANKEQEKRRGKNYFRDVVIKAEDWKEAVTLALEEYFYFAEQALKENPKSERAYLLSRYISLWKNIV
ncbi:hypothetical protein [Saprospira grandis]|uniref:hypothetical protein n=1 Tax=Saprospira grandis TaxID=1008 RepID=UPI0022DD55A8|nr:hypothetical protein [Saprospira grandis]WBM74143.1 hypothetical protein OP864_14235 [Saprospira grandis]